MSDGNHTIDVPAISCDPRSSEICTTKVIQLQMMFTNHTDRDIQGRKTKTRESRYKGWSENKSYTTSDSCWLGILLRAYDGRLFKLSCRWFISRGMEL
jgi:hypothetical protein